VVALALELESLDPGVSNLGGDALPATVSMSFLPPMVLMIQ
jgi:hypothetical protein